MWKDLTVFLRDSFRNKAKRRQLDLRGRLVSTIEHDFADYQLHQAIMHDFICNCYDINGSRITLEGLRA